MAMRWGWVAAVAAAWMIAMAAVPLQATLGVDVSQLTSESSFRCLVSNGYHFAIARGFQSTGRVDPEVLSTLANAWAGGMSDVDVYMFPCPTCGDCAGQARTAVQHLQDNHARFGMFWLDIEGSQYWTDMGSNRNCFSELASTAESMGVKVGVYTSASQWLPIMGDWAGGAKYPLWYAHYDGTTNYNDFSAFAGWSRPAIKQFAGDATVCGAGVDKNWYP